VHSLIYKARELPAMPAMHGHSSAGNRTAVDQLPRRRMYPLRCATLRRSVNCTYFRTLLHHDNKKKELSATAEDFVNIWEIVVR